jgi:predicted GIY-YIG superfamily endonuclease
MPRPFEDAPTCVYVCWSGDELVYVGTTRYLQKRQGDHSAYSRWWPLVDAVDSEWYPTRKEAEAAEKELIWRYRPLHNSLRNFKGQGQRVP